MAAVVSSIALIVFLQQLYYLFITAGGDLFSLGQQSVSFFSVTVLFVTVFYLLIRQLQVMRTHLRLAFTDDLTGLPNRREFNRLLAKQGEAGRTRNQKWAIVYLDLDKFKNINDSYGHEAGDYVLKEFGNRISAVIREKDTVSRLSGDEFAIILREISGEESVRRVASDILQSMRQPIEFDGRSIHMGTSIGASIATGKEDAPSRVLSYADFALMQAKTNGRNTLEVFNPDMAKDLQKQAVIASDLREVIQNQKLIVRYQPLVARSSGELEGVEALVRWEHPTYGAISPAIFVPIAEELGIVDELSWFVLSKACLEIAPFEKLSLAVNISPAHFLQPGFCNGVREVLRATGMAPARLEIEITENVFMAHRDRARETVSRLQKLGIRVALDDFGTGYSNMSFLQSIPVNRIKIDKSFLEGLESRPGAKDLVSTMITLGRSLGLNVTVEGVESADQLEFLRSSQCTEMQGYIFSKPISIHQLKMGMVEGWGKPPAASNPISRQERAA